MVKTKLVSSLLLMSALAVSFAPARAQAQLNLGSGIVITDIDLEGVAIDPVTGILTATGGTVTGTIAGLPFTTDIEDFEIDLIPNNPGTPGEDCAVLHLELAPIDLDLLGLHVDTSAICLDLTAIEGGGLLGDMLCSLAGGDVGGLLGDLLDLDVGEVLSILERLTLLDAVLGGDVEGLDLLGALSQALNTALAGPTTQQEPEDICDGAFEILDLAVGPVNLNLLGLVVNLDDCEDGPVLVCVSADRGQGLLGDLLVGLLGGGLLDGINLGLIEDLLDAILDGLGGNTGLNVPAKQLNQLVGEVGRLLRDGELTDNELNRLEKRIEKLDRKN